MKCAVAFALNCLYVFILLMWRQSDENMILILKFLIKIFKTFCYL